MENIKGEVRYKNRRMHSSVMLLDLPKICSCFIHVVAWYIDVKHMAEPFKDQTSIHSSVEGIYKV